MYMVDSNIWAYYFDANLPEHESVVSFLDPQINSGNIAVSTIIIVEVAHYLFKRLGSIEGFEKSNIFQLAQFETLEFTSRDLDELLATMRRVSHLGLGGRDVTILICMKKAGITHLVTHDQAFSRIKDIEVIDPVVL
ncbi:MAG: type II toxin-antitoxin system VapC family toxin [Promethearchaeota archaeon]